MSRFSPTVRQQSPSPLVAALEGLYTGAQDAIAKRGQQQEADRRRSIEDFNLRSQIESDPRYTTQPPEQAPRLPNIFEGAKPGLAAGARRNPTMGGLGMQGGAPDLATMVEDSAPGIGTDHPQYLPGQFIRDAGSFTERPVFERPRLLRTDLVDQPPAPKPVANVAGMDVYADPSYRTPEQAKQQDLASMIELVGRARAGDQGALDTLMVSSPELYKTVSGDGKVSPDALRAAGVPEAAIQIAASDPVLARQLVTAYNKPPKAEDGVSYTPEQLRTAGIPERFIPAAAADPILARTLVGAYGKPGSGTGSDTTIQDLITRRTLVTNALAAINGLTRYYDPSNPDTADQYAAEVDNILQNYGYDSLEQLQADVKALREPRGDRGARPGRDTPPSRTAGAETGGTQPAGPDVAAIQDRVDELLKAGYTDPEEIKRKLRDEGLVGG